MTRRIHSNNAGAIGIGQQRNELLRTGRITKMGMAVGIVLLSMMTMMSDSMTSFMVVVNAFVLTGNRPTTMSTTTTFSSQLHQQRSMDDLTFEPLTKVELNDAGITEQACIDAASKMKRIAVPVPSTVAPSGSVGISYIHWPADPSTKKSSSPPLILIHGFDSSGLEYRRLGPKLAAAGIDTYAVDVLGWGFTQLAEEGQSFSANSKIQALQSFVQTKVLSTNTKTFCVAGASLGGAAAIELAYALPNECVGMVLIDAQGFVDGVGPMAFLPTPLAKAGVAVLKSVPLRNSANQMSYYNVEKYATEEAQVIGRLHTLRDGWSDAMVNFMQSGGFTPSDKVSQITSPTLVLWGRQDTILDGNEYANKFIETLPGGGSSNSNNELRWIEECGHVPHLEQPEETCDAIVDFVTSSKVAEYAKRASSSAPPASSSSASAATATSSSSSSATATKKVTDKSDIKKDDTDNNTDNTDVRPSPYIVGGGFLGALLIEEAIKSLNLF